jgi:hypothetical protein
VVYCTGLGGARPASPAVLTGAVKIHWLVGCENNVMDEDCEGRRG